MTRPSLHLEVKLKLKAMNGKKKIYWFEKSGHGHLEEEPKKFNEAVLDVLNQMEG
ncbi:MAG: alpha/beta hydrolase [Bacteroidia bacterium]|nr:alpha/beta hydrolase [Bacteroidia bacterium]